MKKTLIFLMIILMTAVFAQAQFYEETRNKLRAGVKAGFIYPETEELKDTVERAIMFGADVTYSFTENIGVGVDLRYANKSWDGVLEEAKNPVDIEWTYMPISFNAILSMEAFDDFYGYIGGGFCMLNTDTTMTLTFGEMSFSGEFSEWVYTYDVLGGLEYRGIFVEAQMIFGSTEFEDEFALLDDDSGEFKVGSFNVMAGYRF